MKLIIDTEVIKDLLETEWGYKGLMDDLDDLFAKNGIPLDNIESKWIPYWERLPEGKINPITQDFEPILCTVACGGLRPYRDIRIYKFGKPMGCHDPHFWDCSQNVDDRVIAWMPLPKPWEGESE